MKLCRTVLHCSLKKAQREIDAVEFAEWKALYQVEPWGDDWEQADLLAVATVNQYARRPFKLGTFIPGRKAKVRQSQAEMQAVAKFAFQQMSALNGGQHRKT